MYFISSFFFRGFVNSLPPSQPDNGVCKPQVSLLVLFWLHQKSENRFAQIIYTQFCKLKDIFLNEVSYYLKGLRSNTGVYTATSNFILANASFMQELLSGAIWLSVCSATYKATRFTGLSKIPDVWVSEWERNTYNIWFPVIPLRQAGF